MAVVGMMSLGAEKASATSLTFSYDLTFSNNVSPNDPAPYMSALFTDVGVSAGNDVRLVLSTNGLSDQEFISGVYFNLISLVNPLNVTATAIQNPNGSYMGLSSGSDCCQADGDGIYDLLLNFNTSAGARFGPNMVGIFDLNWTNGTLHPEYFNLLATQGGGNGPFYTAAHLQGIGANGSLSTWLADGNGGSGDCPGCTINPVDVEPVPEPASLFLLGSGLSAVAMKMRRNRKTSKETV